MNVPNAIIERRAERERWAERHRDAIENHQRSLAIVEAELDCICFAIAAIEDAAKAPNAEAVEVGWVAATSFGYWCPRGRSVGESGNSLVNPQAPEAESAPAGEFEGRSGVACPHCGDVTEQSVLLSEFTCGKCDRVFDLGDARVFRVPLEPAKKPRAPKRPIRSMVLFEAEERPGQAPAQIAKGLDVPLSAVEKAIAYWQAKGRLTLEGGVVQLGELTGKSMLISDRELLGFLERMPDSTIAEIKAEGIPAAAVYRAEKEGVVIAKAHGLYALVEPQQSEAAE